MANITFPPCPWKVTDQALSDWREHQLPAAEGARLAEHVPTCAGCQARLRAGEHAERALRGQRIPDLQAGIWRGVHRQLAQSQPRRTIPVKRVSVVGAVTAILMVALFVVYLSTNRGAGHPTTTLAPTQTPTVAVDLNPLTPAQAWGAAGQQTITLDALEYTVDGVLPNGSGILVTYPISSTTHAPLPQPRIALINPATGVAQLLYTTTTWNHATAATDGRYIAWLGGYNATGGPSSSNITVGYLDTQTGQTHLLSNGTNDALDSTAIYVTHGKLILVSNKSNYSIYEVDLATGTTKTFLPPHLQVTFSWPYLLAVNTVDTGVGKPDPSLSPPTTLLNLETGQTTDLTNVLHFSYYFANNVAMDGATVFTTKLTAANDGIQFSALDHADRPNPQPHALFILPTSVPSNPNEKRIFADSRLLLINMDDVGNSKYVWDRQLGKLISLPAVPPNSSGDGMLLNGGFFAYWQQSGATTQLVLRDEAQLPK
jgi:hypothetical protein